MKIILDLDKLRAMGLVEVVDNDHDIETVKLSPAEKAKQSGRTEAIELLNFLNEKAGRNYHPVPANIGPIKQRVREYGKDTLQQMIARQVNEWKGTDMEDFLRPATLFNATKCAQYVGKLVVK